MARVRAAPGLPPWPLRSAAVAGLGFGPRLLGGFGLEALLLQAGEKLLQILCLGGQFLGSLLFRLEPLRRVGEQRFLARLQVGHFLARLQQAARRYP